MSVEFTFDNAKLYKILYCNSIITMPNIFLFNIYNQNRESTTILFTHVLILAAILAVISVLGGSIAWFLTRSVEGSFLSLISAWLIFWFFETLRTSLQTSTTGILLIIILLTITCLIILFRSLSNYLKKGRVIFSAMFGVVILLFMFNAFPTFITATQTLRVSTESSESEWKVRRYFEVDTTLPNPDIYWFHMDGMLSLDIVEYFFNVTQNEPRERLLDLGFIINEDAELFSSNTLTGVSALLSPDFYDNFIHRYFVGGQFLLGLERRQLHSGAIEREGISFANDLAPYYELFHAFLQAGYTATMIAEFNPNVYPVINRFYRLYYGSFAIRDRTSERHFLIDAIDLIDLLAMMTPIPNRFVNTIEGVEWHATPTRDVEVDRLTTNTLNLPHEREVYRSLINSLENHPETPTLTYITLTFTHGSLWEQHGNIEADGSGIELYPLIHDYAFYVMFNLINIILAQKPNAVIVIQADHGVHWHAAQQALLEENFTEEEVIRLYNSVISAVRIPEQYGGLNAPLDPLNITRELVNRFVGKNYDLISE